jgi:hypothetical protein
VERAALGPPAGAIVPLLIIARGTDGAGTFVRARGGGCSVVDADFCTATAAHAHELRRCHSWAKGTGRVAVDDATAGGHASTVGVGALLLVPARLAVPFDLPIRFTATLSSSASSPSWCDPLGPSAAELIEVE